MLRKLARLFAVDVLALRHGSMILPLFLFSVITKMLCA